MIPPSLSALPVASQIHTLDFERERFICRASTGTGKTVLIPAYEISMRKARGEDAVVLLRQPTKLTVQYIRSAIAKFWPDLKVGVSTRDEKHGIEDADIVVISDGSLTGVLEKVKGRNVIYYIDEAHAPTGEVSEIEWGIAKKLNLTMRFLSATVDAGPLVEYLGGDVPVYDLEGRTFPIERDVEVVPRDAFNRDDHGELLERLRDHVSEAKFDSDGILVFVPTRKMAEEIAESFAADLPTTFAHGGVSPVELEAWTAAHQGEAFLVVATTAAAMGITIGNVGRVVICDEVVDSEVRLGVERQFTCPMPDNLLLQASGRCGRVKPGRATLLAPSSSAYELASDRDWADVAPRPIVGPCGKSTPYSVIMALAQHGIHRDSEVDLYSKLDPIEMKHARDELVAMRCLDGEGKLTRLGRLVQLTPLEPHMAHLVHTAPGRDAKIAVLAGILMSQQGTFQLVRQKPKEVGPGGILLPPECLHPGSAPMTLAHILQSYAALPSGSRRDWCARSNLNERILAFTLRDYKAAAESLDDADASDLAEALDFDDADLRARVDAHVASHRSLRKIRMTGTWGKIWMPPPTGMLGCVLDSVLMQAWRAEGYVGHVAGIASIRKARSGSDFATLDFVVLEKAA